MQPIEYLEQLLKIESHETIDEIQEYLLETVEGAQLDDTGCIYSVKNGVEDGPQLVLNTHMDVVSPHLPFERDGDIIRGRGACDAKGSLAAMIAAFSRVEPRSGSVRLVISPDEETTHRGLVAYLSEENIGKISIVVQGGYVTCSDRRLSDGIAHSWVPQITRGADGRLIEVRRKIITRKHSVVNFRPIIFV